MVTFNYNPLPPNLTILESGLHGLGLFAVCRIESAVELGKTHYLVDDQWERTPLGGFINHSDTPNCVITYSKSGQHRILHTVRPIIAGEELTIYYTLNQSPLTSNKD